MKKARTNKQNEPFEPSPPQQEILKAVNTFQSLSVEQLADYLERKNLNRVRELTNELVTNEYLQAVRLYRNSQKGSTPNIFFLATNGIRWLEDEGVEVWEHRARLSTNRDRKAKPSLHTLQVNDFLISAKQLTKAHEDIQLFSFKHEREYKTEPIIVSPIRIVGDGLREETIPLSPDGYLDFRLGSRREQVCLFLEMDLDTDNERQIRRKIAAYVQFVKKFKDAEGKFTSQYNRLYFTDAVSIIFPTTSETHRETLREWTRRELQTSKEPDYIAELFLFAPFPPRTDAKGNPREGVQFEPTRTFLESIWKPPFDKLPSVSLLG